MSDVRGGSRNSSTTNPETTTEYARELRAAGLTSTTRSEFLKRSVGAGVGLVAGAGLLSLAGCAASPAASLDEAETPELTVGFIPINCATPIIMASPLGFYERYGLNVTLLKFGGWSEIRDAAIAGEIDAAHLLAPIPLALSMGIGPPAIPMRLAAIENINGQAITLAKKHLGNVEGPQDMKGMKLGIPFEFSMHALLLRAYLAEGGVDPDRDVQLVVMRPPDMVALLAVGNIDGFLGPEPVNQRAVYEGAGFIHELSRDMWDGHPCCSFSVRQQFIEENPRTYQSLLRAIVDATGYSQKLENRTEIASAIAPAEFLNQPVEVVEAEPEITISTQSSVESTSGKSGRGWSSPSAERLRVFGLFAVLLVSFLAVWEAVVRLGLMSELMPPPSEVISSLVVALSNPFYVVSANDAGIGVQLGTSLLRVLVGFVAAMVVALPLGVFLGTSSTLGRAVDPFVQVLRPVSPLAWLPIGLALLRDSEQTAIFVIFISALWPMLLNTIAATRSVPRSYLEVARTLRAGRWTTMLRIILPAALPNILTGLRVSMGVAWLVIIAAEMLIGGRGIGYFIWNQWNNLDIANIMVAILLVGLVGLLLDRAFGLLERRFAYDG